MSGPADRGHQQDGGQHECIGQVGIAAEQMMGQNQYPHRHEPTQGQPDQPGKAGVAQRTLEHPVDRLVADVAHADPVRLQERAAPVDP